MPKPLKNFESLQNEIHDKRGHRKNNSSSSDPQKRLHHNAKVGSYGNTTRAVLHDSVTGIGGRGACATFEQL